MTTHSLFRFRLSILGALGLSACGGGPISLEEGSAEDSDSASAGESSESDTSTDTDTSTETDSSTDTEGPSVPPGECLDPVPIMQLGTDIPSGFVECGDGFIHRETIVDDITGPAMGNCGGNGTIEWGCQEDSECIDGVNGVCNDDFAGGCACQYGCERDADCNEGSICAPAGVVDTRARCIVADCPVTDSCAGGLCGLERWNDVCGVPRGRVACTTEDSSCRFHDECGTACADQGWEEQLRCSAAKGWQCQTEEEFFCGDYCGEGRPFIVDGELRVAEPCANSAWSGGYGSEQHTRFDPSLDPRLDAGAREALAAHWTRVGQFEHASVASFNRFALQLLALAGPPQLLRETLRAASDEVRHAQLAFELASRYAGAPIGPGALPIDDALTDAKHDTSLESVTRSLIAEACIGETLAAIEAHHSAALARDPEVRAVLTAIAEDELRHAELGWACLRWLLEQRAPQLRAPALRWLEEGLAATRGAVGGEDILEVSHPELVAHGLLDAGERARLRRQAIDRVLTPCVEALHTRFDSTRLKSC